jgi:hypothetical protein
MPDEHARVRELLRKIGSVRLSLLTVDDLLDIEEIAREVRGPEPIFREEASAFADRLDRIVTLVGVRMRQEETAKTNAPAAKASPK